MKARNRPPRLEARPPNVPTPAPPATPEELLVRARVAGKVTTPGPREFRHQVAKLDANPVEVWAAVRAVFGASDTEPQIDPTCTVRAARVAAARLGAAARAGGRIGFATSQPASMLGVHHLLSERARAAGASVEDADDAGPMRIDGRGPRWLRWLDGVTVVTDGASILSTEGPEAADEWLFLSGRPSLVVTDGPFAVAAVAAGIETIAFAGLDRLELAVPAASAKGCLVVPVHAGRPARAYAALVSLFDDTLEGDVRASEPDPEL
jgi:hypothetical protein